MNKCTNLLIIRIVLYIDMYTCSVAKLQTVVIHEWLIHHSSQYNTPNPPP